MPAPPAERRSRRDAAPGLAVAAAPVVFAGEFRHAMDPKHRVTIPARWRRADAVGGADEYFLIPSQENDYLQGYPPAEFEAVARRVSENPVIPPRDKQIFIRGFYGKAQHCPLDRQGRLLVPDDLRRIAGLGDDLLLIGAHSRFEIWNPARWRQVDVDAQATYRQVANLVGL